MSYYIECNTRKGDRPAPDFLRTLYRLGRLTPAELDARLRALKALAAGKLRPVCWVFRPVLFSSRLSSLAFPRFS